MLDAWSKVGHVRLIAESLALASVPLAIAGVLGHSHSSEPVRCPCVPTIPS